MDTLRKTNKSYGLGFTAYEKLRQSDKQETITITFSKGKEDLLVENIERVNVYDDCINIFFKDKTSMFINLYQVTTIK